MSQESLRYVLVTPARNEGSHIGKTLESVVRQTIRPVRWVVVDDNSTDDTGAIMRGYAAECDFIRCLSAPQEARKNFGSKVKAFQAGCALLAGCEYDYIGILDGDVSFEPDYFEQLFALVRQDARLGLAGGIIMEEVNGRFVPQLISPESVAGAVQMFRRECFEQIGGLRPLELGGVDSFVEIMARMHGWRVRTFPQLRVYHHGRVTMGGRNVLASRFRKGLISYSLGYHPLFQIAVGVSRMGHRPYFFGGALQIAGYMWAALAGMERTVPTSMVAFLRNEQLKRLRLRVPRRRSSTTPTSGNPTPAVPSSENVV